MNEATRSTSKYVSKQYIDTTVTSLLRYKSPSWNGPGWYKFADPAGTKIATSAPPSNRCGTRRGGYMVEPHPTQVGQTKKVKFCFNYHGNSCFENTLGEVTKCGEGDFVYKLPNSPFVRGNYYFRYCAVP